MEIFLAIMATAACILSVFGILASVGATKISATSLKTADETRKRVDDVFAATLEEAKMDPHPSTFPKQCTH